MRVRSSSDLTVISHEAAEGEPIVAAAASSATQAASHTQQVLMYQEPPQSTHEWKTVEPAGSDASAAAATAKAELQTKQIAALRRRVDALYAVLSVVFVAMFAVFMFTNVHVWDLADEVQNTQHRCLAQIKAIEATRSAQWLENSNLQAEISLLKDQIREMQVKKTAAAAAAAEAEAVHVQEQPEPQQSEPTPEEQYESDFWSYIFNFDLSGEEEEAHDNVHSTPTPAPAPAQQERIERPTRKVRMGTANVNR